MGIQTLRVSNLDSCFRGNDKNGNDFLFNLSKFPLERFLTFSPMEGGERIPMARKYSKKASKTVERALHKEKEGTLKSGRSGKKVTSRKQAIAIGLSEAREKGQKVPPKKKS